MNQTVKPINSRPMARAKFNTFTIRKMVGWNERGLLMEESHKWQYCVMDELTLDQIRNVNV